MITECLAELHGIYTVPVLDKSNFISAFKDLLIQSLWVTNIFQGVFKIKFAISNLTVKSTQKKKKKTLQKMYYFATR